MRKFVAISIALVIAFSLHYCRTIQVLPYQSELSQEYHQITVPLSDSTKHGLSSYIDQEGKPLAWYKVSPDSIDFGFFHSTTQTKVDVVSTPTHISYVVYRILIFALAIAFIVILFLFLTRKIR